MRLLVVEDEPKLRTLIDRAARRDGWAVDAVANGTDAIWSATEIAYDAIALDIGIPAPDGFEVCRTLRERGCWTPILFLTAREGIADRVEGLDAGGDDYLIKPFSVEELGARLRALARRSLGERPVLLVAGDLHVDVAKRTVCRGDDNIRLSNREFAVLEMLIRNKGDVVSRETLLEHVWDANYDGFSNVVDVHIRQVRAKIDRPFAREAIETVRGAGYRLDPDGGSHL